MIAKDPALDRRIWMLAWPLLLSNITAPLLGLVDTAVVGHLDSPVYLAAVALGSNVFMFLYFSFNFLRMGTTGFTSQARGAGEATLVVLLRALLLSTLVGSALILLRLLGERRRCSRSKACAYFAPEAGIAGIVTEAMLHL